MLERRGVDAQKTAQLHKFAHVAEGASRFSLACFSLVLQQLRSRVHAADCAVHCRRSRGRNSPRAYLHIYA